MPADQLVLDGDWRIESIGGDVIRSVGLMNRPVPEIRGRRLWEVIPQLVGSKVETLLREAMHRHQSVDFEWLQPCSNATLEIRGWPVARTLTLQIRAATTPSSACIGPRDTQPASEELEASLALKAEPAYACSALGRFVYANRAALELFGRSLADLVGRKFGDVGLSAEIAAPLQRQIEQTLLFGEEGTAVVAHEDGRKNAVRHQHRLTALRDPAGAVWRIVGIAQVVPLPTPVDTPPPRRADPVPAPPPAQAQPFPPPVLPPAREPAPCAVAVEADTRRNRVLREVASHLLKDSVRKAPLFGALQRLARAIDAEIYLLHGASPNGLQLRFEASGGVGYEELGSAANPAVGEGLCGAAARDDWPIVLDDVQSNERPEAVEPRAWRARAAVCHPLNAGGRLLGTLAFASTSRDRFSADELGFIRDAAELIAGSLETRRVLDEAAHRRALAEETAKHKDHFLARVSHELRTPLNPALLVASHAVDNPELAPAVRDDFESIMKNIRVEVRLIDDLLDATRTSFAKLSVHLRPLSLHAVLLEALATVKPELEEKRLELTLDLVAGSPWIMGDAVRVQQVFWNILKNAVKFTPECGALLVRTAVIDDHVCIEFTDTGAGLTDSEIAHAFDSFAQGEHARNGASPLGGLGLGLAIARDIVGLHSGQIHVASAGRDRGASFTVELPLIAEPAEPPAEAAAPTAPARDTAAVRGLRILLVEDHPATREALLKLLVERHHEVIAASSVGEARAIALRKPVELVISDIGLPDGTGYELMSALHADFGVRGIALTGHGTEQHIAHGRAAGFVAHLIKPVSIQALEALLSEVALDSHAAVR